MEQVATGVLRVTFRLPFGLDHVHCYLLRGADGGWILVDTGLGLGDAAERGGRCWTRSTRRSSESSSRTCTRITSAARPTSRR